LWRPPAQLVESVTVTALYQIFDTAITFGSFVLDLVFIEQMSSSTKGEETIALLVIFLLWRVLRLVNGKPPAISS